LADWLIGWDIGDVDLMGAMSVDWISSVGW